jgi:hypothetical protein
LSARFLAHFIENVPSAKLKVLLDERNPRTNVSVPGILFV